MGCYFANKSDYRIFIFLPGNQPLEFNHVCLLCNINLIKLDRNDYKNNYIEVGGGGERA